MTDDPKHVDIEAEIAEERDALAEGLSKLTAQLSSGGTLVHSVGETLKSQSDDLAHAVVRGAKENPAALALVGAGLAWLLLSKSSEARSSGTPAPAAYDTRPHRPVGGFREDATPEDAAFKARVAAAEAALQQPHEADDPSLVAQLSSSACKSAAEMRATLYDGTSELSDLARARVVEARRKALIAQERAEHHAHSAKDRGKTFYQENPLLVGAGIAALGAAIALALPRTRAEDETFGGHRDALVAEADRVLHEEIARVRAMASAAADEAQTMAQEAVDEFPSGEDAVERTEETARAAGDRIAARARTATPH
ncbi:hypothetical protein [Jannaschia seohaensis]|uniref:DUF3618 domain-containing protein n=1 Tax=Jannaschia seohaensis TaxID=475081 RepID=A0A2Y9A6W2_9RHOB|nr:hypothetical protein [Jannaschia seohaensis]PWJ22051.1 hypothetical protein BCF38_101460 [Jannaschia seohaensis]SSA38329.1 hypothetical protein SAMN05421539_101460 [Jannaschia seohaensis]